jgi:hypothetical protein
MRPITATLGILWLAGCGARTATPAPVNTGTGACGPSGTPYDITRSRFAFGTTPAETTGDMTRWTGANGVLAISRLGSERASLNGGTAPANRPDWSADPDALSAHVRDYFISLGVEACQVRSSNVMGSASGQRTIALNRAIDGITVDDSLAFARIDQDDQSTDEALWWPDIPADVLAQARAFRDRLADPAARAAYQALLPSTAQTQGEVMIRHTGASSLSTTFQAQAVYLVVGPARGEGGSFDESGVAVTTDW